MTALLFDHLWQSSVFAGCAGLLTLLFRSNRADVRFGLWFAASLKFLIPFSVFAMLGAAAAPGHLNPTATALIVQAQPAAMPFTTTDGMEAPLFAISAAPGGFADVWPGVFLTVWLTGTIGLLAFWSIKFAKLMAVVRGARPLPIAAPIPVRSSPALMEPGLVGIWRPVLLLPDGIAGRLTLAEMNAIVAHEMCHARRRDNLTALLHMVVQAVFWFYPLVWWIGRKLVAEREQACDEAVVAQGNDPGVYAESILKVCKFYLRSPLDCAPGVSGADLKRRVEAIMANRFVKSLSRAKKIILAGAAAMVLGVPVAVGMIPPPVASAPASGTASPGTEAALRHLIEAWEAQRPDTARLAPGLAKLVLLARTHTQQELEIWGALKAIKFQGRSANGRDVYSVTFANALTSWQIMLAPDGKIGGLQWWVAYARNDKTKPSPGTETALRHQITAWQRHRPAIEDMSPLAAAAAREQQAHIQNLFDGWGELKSIAFDGVDFRGWDIYDIGFRNGRALAFIGPLTPDGKVDAISFTRNFTHTGPSPGTEASLKRYIESLEAGAPNYDEMAPQLAAVVRDQLPGILTQINAWGPLKSVTFKSVDPSGLDLYDVMFAHGRALWRIAPLTPDGKVEIRGFSAAGNKGSTDQIAGRFKHNAN